MTEPSPELLQWASDNLVLANPEYAKKVRMGFWVGNTPKLIYLYEQTPSSLQIPYGCLRSILPYINYSEISKDFLSCEDVDFGGTIALYDYQDEAVTALLKAQYGILQSPAGSGKTQMGLALAERLGKRTLWLTHTRDLLQQSQTRAETYFDKSGLGTITEGKVDIGNAITFATIQTMCNLDLPQYSRIWDTVIVDECHRVVGTPTAVTMFSKVLNNLCARHKYGLSATVHRADGLIQATFALIGPVVYEVPAEAVADKVMTVHVQPIDTGIGLDPEYLNTDGTINYAKMITWMGMCDERNDIILKDLMANSQHSNLILSDRVGHLRRLMNSLPLYLQKRAAVIDGKMTSKTDKAKRVNAIEMMRTGELSYLFATYALCKEGLDIPRLDRLYLVTPQKDYAIITQAVGRVARTFPDKDTPIVYDYIDNLTFLEKSYKKRRTSYKKAGCVIEERRSVE